MKLIKQIFIIFALLASASAAFAGDLENNIRNFQPLVGNISTSGTIGSNGYLALANHDFDIIIDARTPPEGTAAEQQQVQALGMKYYNLPIGNAIPLSHISALDKILAENKGRKILIHCVSANRAGGLWADYQISKGTDPLAALAQGRKIGMSSRLEFWVKNKHGLKN